mmetsp:Transcript_11879/g.46406  ORF Transcript_11879/g.46406 Transcript_11879/m.46406 type:complete len:353 (+) Transcript_11879:3725-4783(+)
MDTTGPLWTITAGGPTAVTMHTRSATAAASLITAASLSGPHHITASSMAARSSSAERTAEGSCRASTGRSSAPRWILPGTLFAAPPSAAGAALPEEGPPSVKAHERSKPQRPLRWQSRQAMEEATWPARRAAVSREPAAAVAPRAAATASRTSPQPGSAQRWCAATHASLASARAAAMADRPLAADPIQNPAFHGRAAARPAAPLGGGRAELCSALGRAPDASASWRARQSPPASDSAQVAPLWPVGRAAAEVRSATSAHSASLAAKSRGQALVMPPTAAAVVAVVAAVEAAAVAPAVEAAPAPAEEAAAMAPTGDGAGAASARGWGGETVWPVDGSLVDDHGRRAQPSSGE